MVCVLTHASSFVFYSFRNWEPMVVAVAEVCSFDGMVL